MEKQQQLQQSPLCQRLSQFLMDNVDIVTPCKGDDVDLRPLEYLCETQSSFAHPKDYLKFYDGKWRNAKRMNCRTRIILIDWLAEFAYNYEFGSCVFGLAVRLFDRACTSRRIVVTDNNFQLVGVTCFMMAIKYEAAGTEAELWIDGAQRNLALGMAYMCDNKRIAKQDIIQMETRLWSNVFDFRLNIPTARAIFDLMPLKLNNEERLAVEYMLDLSTQAIKFLAYDPQDIVFAAVYIARIMFTSTTQNIQIPYNGHTEKCYQDMFDLVFKPDQYIFGTPRCDTPQFHHNIYHHYAAPERGEISLKVYNRASVMHPRAPDVEVILEQAIWLKKWDTVRYILSTMPFGNLHVFVRQMGMEFPEKIENAHSIITTRYAAQVLVLSKLMSMELFEIKSQC